MKDKQIVHPMQTIRFKIWVDLPPRASIMFKISRKNNDLNTPLFMDIHVNNLHFAVLVKGEIPEVPVLIWYQCKAVVISETMNWPGFKNNEARVRGTRSQTLTNTALKLNDMQMSHVTLLASGYWHSVTKDVRHRQMICLHHKCVL